jgi:hypothetical protein
VAVAHDAEALAVLRAALGATGARLAGDNREFEVTSFPLW